MSDTSLLVIHEWPIKTNYTTKIFITNSINYEIIVSFTSISSLKNHEKWDSLYDLLQNIHEVINSLR